MRGTGSGFSRTMLEKNGPGIKPGMSVFADLRLDAHLKLPLGRRKVVVLPRSGTPHTQALGFGSDKCLKGITATGLPVFGSPAKSD